MRLRKRSCPAVSHSCNLTWGLEIGSWGSWDDSESQEAPKLEGSLHTHSDPQTQTQMYKLHTKKKNPTQNSHRCCLYAFLWHCQGPTAAGRHSRQFPPSSMPSWTLLGWVWMHYSEGDQYCSTVFSPIVKLSATLTHITHSFWWH